MKRGSIRCLLIATLLWMSLTVCAAGEARSVYIGDIVTLRLEGQGVTEESIRQAFEGFDIVSLDRTSDGYRLSLRTFEAGAHSAVLAGREIILDVRSTLDDIERDDVFEGSPDVLEGGFALPWRVLLYVAAGLFAVSGGLVLIGHIWRRLPRSETAYARFLRVSAGLSPVNDRYFVDLTRCFKEYIESLLGRRVIGDTSTEIMQALEAAQAYDPLLPDIRAWLLACDRMKFSGIAVSTEEKQDHASRLRALVEGLEKHRSNIDEGTK